MNTLYTGLKDLISKEHAYLLTKIRLLTNNVLSLKPLFKQLQTHMYIILCFEDSSFQVLPGFAHLFVDCLVVLDVAEETGSALFQCSKFNLLYILHLSGKHTMTKLWLEISLASNFQYFYRQKLY